MPEPYRVVSALPAGTAFARYLLSKGLEQQGGAHLALEVAETHWRGTPQVAATLKAEYGFEGKAAVAAGSTTDATFAAPLAQYGIAREALELLRGASILGALSSRFRRVPFLTKVPRETGTGAGGAWVGQGLATPVAALAYDTLSLEAYKSGKIVVLTKELQKIGDPDAERTVRDTVIGGVAAYADGQLLDPTITLSANLRPASITNSATAVTSTGSSASQITTDLNGLIAAITTNAAGLTWVMRPITAARIAATLGVAATGLPATLFTIPVITSANSPAQITLVDTSHILFAENGNAFEVDFSEHAALQMDDAPTNPPVAATVMVSLFQLNLWAVRVTRWLAYLRAQTGAVSYMTVTY